MLDELLADEDTHPLSMFLTGADWIQTEPYPKSSSLRLELGRGETAAITLAYESRADVIVLDDLQTGRVASDLGIWFSEGSPCRDSHQRGTASVERSPSHGPSVA